MLHMGRYAIFLRDWLLAFGPERLRVLWLEQFKADPFACLHAVETFVGLPHHNFRHLARRNSAGYWVVGRSKSNSASTFAAPRLISSESFEAQARQRTALATLRAYYEPWQRRLSELLEKQNISLVGEPPAPMMPGYM